jgi:hypothetical protein
VRVGVVFEKNTSCKSYFPVDARCISRHIGPFSCVVGTHESLQGKPSLLAAGALVHCFPVRIDLVFERDTSFKTSFQSGNKLIVFQKSPIQLS